MVDCNLRDPNTPTTEGRCLWWLEQPGTSDSALSATRVNPDIMSGWGVRPVDQQFNISVQQEVLPRVSVEVGYARRSWDNIYYTHSEGLTSAELRCDRLPDPAAPGSAGWRRRHGQVPDHQPGRADRIPEQHLHERAGGRGRHVLVARYGPERQRPHAQRVDDSGRHHLGRRAQEICGVWAAYPNLVGNNRLDACDIQEEWTTNFRGLASYTIPRIDVLVSTIMALDARRRCRRRVHGVRLERLLAERELHRSGSGDHADSRPAAGEQCAQRDAQPGQAGRRLQASYQRG